MSLGGVAGAGLLSGLGGGVANVIFAPLIAATNFLSSYWYGAGLILGERQMYTSTWPEVKRRMEKGETFENVIGSYIDSANAVVAGEAKRIMDDLIKQFSFTTHEAVNNIIQGFDFADVIPDFGPDPNADPNKFKPPAPQDTQNTTQQSRDDLENRFRSLKDDNAKKLRKEINKQDTELKGLSLILAEMTRIQGQIKSMEWGLAHNPGKSKSTFERNIRTFREQLAKQDALRKRWLRVHPDLVRKYKLKVQ